MSSVGSSPCTTKMGVAGTTPKMSFGFGQDWAALRAAAIKDVILFAVPAARLDE